MRRKTAFEAFAPTILEVYHRDEEAFWAAVMAPFLADRGSVFTWLKHLKVTWAPVGIQRAGRGGAGSPERVQRGLWT